MIGYWNKSVYITYLGAMVSVLGYLMFCKTADPDWAFAGMILAVVCDMFDGKVARKIKNRTEQEKEFGVQIDSLADIVAFIVIPSLTLYGLGLNQVYQLILISLYVVCGVIRLAYFNVAMSDKDKAIKIYTGLPVPVSVLIFGIVWMLAKFIPFVDSNQVIILTILLPIVGYLHISKIKIKKFTGSWFYILISVVALLAIIIGAILL